MVQLGYQALPALMFALLVLAQVSVLLGPPTALATLLGPATLQDSGSLALLAPSAALLVLA